MTNDSYWSATKHPWACVLFVVPLLAVYEIGLHTFGQPGPETLRNGADLWLRSALAAVGIVPLYGAPCTLILVLLAWGLICQEDRPRDQVGVWVGMVTESAGFALLLFGLSQATWMMLLGADRFLGESTQRIALLQWSASPEATWGQIIAYIGAGIYEETLFRLLIFALLVRLFTWTHTQINTSKETLYDVVLAGLASALLFAAAHHVGETAEPFRMYVFSFRVFAGCYFAWLFHVRGFGIAVGAHAGYDLLVGLILQPL